MTANEMDLIINGNNQNINDELQGGNGIRNAAIHINI
jgi:hypothetical protein